uniref:Si:ch211-226m7.4 n=1 Tax=Scleropages formosus TaxID=113540 RepID=A0A8C9R9R7_SCLFO
EGCTTTVSPSKSAIFIMIEQKYSNKVLIGNWVEDRLQFSRECGAPRSIHRQDYRPHKDHQPNVIVQRASLRRAEGLPGKLLLGHHGAPHSHYLVSVYGETYGRQTCGTLDAELLRTCVCKRLWQTQPVHALVSSAPPMTFRPTASWCPPWPKRRSDVPALTTYRASYPLWHPLPTPVSQPKVCRDAPVVHRPQCE